MEAIKEIIRPYSFSILIYAISITIILVIILLRQKSLKNKYIDWKRDVLKLPFYSREWERNDDELLLELYTENERLDAELSVRNKDFTKLTILTLLLILPTILKSKFKKQKTSG